MPRAFAAFVKLPAFATASNARSWSVSITSAVLTHPPSGPRFITSWRAMPEASRSSKVLGRSMALFRIRLSLWHIEDDIFPILSIISPRGICKIDKLDFFGTAALSCRAHGLNRGADSLSFHEKERFLAIDILLGACRTPLLRFAILSAITPFGMPCP